MLLVMRQPLTGQAGFSLILLLDQSGQTPARLALWMVTVDEEGLEPEPGLRLGFEAQLRVLETTRFVLVAPAMPVDI